MAVSKAISYVLGCIILIVLIIPDCSQARDPEGSIKVLEYLGTTGTIISEPEEVLEGLYRVKVQLDNGAVDYYATGLKDLPKGQRVQIHNVRIHSGNSPFAIRIK